MRDHDEGGLDPVEQAKVEADWHQDWLADMGFYDDVVYWCEYRDDRSYGVATILCDGVSHKVLQNAPRELVRGMVLAAIENQTFTSVDRQ